ncbi:MAG: hypothetical protein RLZZ385_2638 [Pseudomonadota bacterium]|jgi:uncharacterized protein with NRDE domain
MLPDARGPVKRIRPTLARGWGETQAWGIMPPMCLILFAHRVDPQRPLVLIANRDEFFSRPTREARFWTEDPATADLLAGQDLGAGGTWVGWHRNGRWAAVTNIRNPADTRTANRSRGELPLMFLLGHLSPMDTLHSLLASRFEYAGFNLLLGAGDDIAYLNSDAAEPRLLSPGIYGLSNGRLDDPWPKVRRGRQHLQQWLDSPVPPGTDGLLGLVRDTAIAPDSELPVTGISMELERQLSASFIVKSERDYGTRCSTAIIRNVAGEVRFCEQNYGKDGLVAGRHFYQFMGS